jgi:nucleoside-diphosphate-sugar epimerase
VSRVVVAGGAGFLGSHLCDRLIARGDEVVCLDDLSTGRTDNVAHLVDGPRFTFIEADVSETVPVTGTVDAVCNLASPASPPAYLARPLATLAVGSEGTRRLLDLATANGARFLLASTSEVYGDPTVHPQPESYRGNVDSTGPRSVYDEAKRFAEALSMASHRALGTNVCIARIFNTYGPRLAPGDGRVVSNFVTQALAGEPLTIFGDGTQTRSLCFVDDEVGGLLSLLDSAETGPLNLGNPDERTVLDLARAVLEITGSPSDLTFHPLPTDDPVRRCPDITRTKALLGWAPTIPLEEGLARTVEYFSALAPGAQAPESGAGERP